tara:strand:+ start:274 stop:585 length:312 start_codon:yes stop_codon:yes gene_type:complete
MYSQLDFSQEYYGTNVKKITGVKCDYVDRFGSYEKENCWTGSIKKFNTDGKIIENSFYDSLDFLTHKETIEYNSNGEMIKIIRYKGEILIPLSFNEWIFEYYD